MRKSRISFGTLVTLSLVAALISGCSSEGGTGAVDALSHVTKLECARVAENKTEGFVTVINKSEKPAQYNIKVVVESVDGTIHYDDSSVMVRHLQPGQSATRTLNTAFYDLPPGAVCVLQKVTRWVPKVGTGAVDALSDVTKLQCAKVSKNKTQAVVTVINKSEKPADYYFVVMAESENGATNYDFTNGHIKFVQPGQTAIKELVGFRGLPPGAVCVLRRAERRVAD